MRSPLPLLLAVLCLGSAQAAALRAIHLRCENQLDPLGIDVEAPRLSWVLDSERRGERQSAYQVLVASQPQRLTERQADLWNSGKVLSDAQNQITYAGQKLRPNQTCFWRVRAWNLEEKAGAWSEPAQWAMGLLKPEDWTAKWISHPRDKPADSAPLTQRSGLPIFRREFMVARTLRRAVVHVSGLGQYDLYLDDKKVGDHFLDPAWSVYEKTVYYNSFDLSDRLPPGRHVFGVMLGKGFYNTQGDRRVHGVNANRPLKLILQAHLLYTDGTEETVVSDGSWRTLEGPITHSAILGGEDYDARRLPVGWGRPGFDDAAWERALETAGPSGTLRASESPPLKEAGVFRPVRIDEPTPGRFVYDFGQNASAIPKLRVRGQAGQTLRLVPAEQRQGMTPRRNDGRGEVNPAGVGRPNYFQYTLRSDTDETWSPQFTYSGFQYLQLEGGVPANQPNPNGLPVVEELVSAHVCSSAPSVGQFSCSNRQFNDIDRIIDWAVRANLSHVLTDCPHREKLGWLEVSYLMGPSIAGRYDLSRLYAKVTRDCIDSQQPSGLVPTVAPAYPAFSGGFAYTPEWGAAAVVVPWQLYEWYGDRALLESAYPAMKGFVDYLRTTSTNLVPLAGLGDWYDYGHGKPVGPSQFTPIELSAMATFYRCAAIVARSAAVLNQAEDQNRYAGLARQVAEAFNRDYFDGSGEYKNLGSPQTANGMALTLGLVPPGHENAVLERIVADLQKRGQQQTAGDIGHWYLLKALSQEGRSDVIATLTARTNLGSYGFILQNGWTSMPEAWDADTGASMNHCMLGHIQEWFLGSVAGIQPDPSEPGFRNVIIRPEPVGDLTWARGSYESIRGRIRSEWNSEPTRFALLVEIPPNTTATVILPVPDASNVSEGGKRLASVKNVRVLSSAAAPVRLEVGSGLYHFECAR